MPRYAKGSLEEAIYEDIVAQSVGWALVPTETHETRLAKRHASASFQRKYGPESLAVPVTERKNSKLSRAHRLESLSEVVARVRSEGADLHDSVGAVLTFREVSILLQCIEDKMAGSMTVGGFPVTGSEWMMLIRKLFQA